MVAAEGNGIPDRGLAGFLDARARNASDGRIAIDIAVGSAAVIVAAGLRPEWWPVLAAAGLTLASFGCWAITGRALEAGSPSKRARLALEFAHKVLAVVGIAAAIGTGFLVWTMLMGTWIS
jgi:hypothetical protein